MSGYFKKVIAMARSKVALKFFGAFLFAAAILFSFVMFYSYNRFKENTIRDFIGYKQEIIGQISRSVDGNINAKDFQSTALAYNLDLLRPYLGYSGQYADYEQMEREKQVGVLLNNLIITNHINYDGIAIFSAEGELRTSASADGYPVSRESIWDEPWFENVLKANGSAVVSVSENLFPGRGNSDPVVIVARTINDYSNAHKVLGISVFYQRVTKFTKGIFYNQGDNGYNADTYFIITPENRILYMSSNDEGIIRQLLERDITNLSSGQIVNIDGVEQYIVCNTSPQYHYFSAILIPRSVADQKTDALKQLFAAIIIIMLLVGTVLSLVLSAVIAHPIKQIFQAIEEVGQGNLDIAIPSRGTDEVAQIGKNVSLLVDSVKSLMSAQYEQQLYLKDIELEALQNKINPHFLYNTLSMLSTLIRNGDVLTANQMVENLSDIFRYCLSRGNNIVTIAHEVLHVRKYLDIQQIRFKNRLKISYDIDQELLHCKILRVTLQPVVENAIIHGIEPLSEGGSIELFTKSNGDTLYLYVSDNGAGMPEQKMESLNRTLSQLPQPESYEKSKKLIGLYNVNARIKLLFGGNYGIHLSANEGRGVIVRLTLPLDYSEEKSDADFSSRR